MPKVDPVYKTSCVLQRTSCMDTWSFKNMHGLSLHIQLYPFLQCSKEIKDHNYCSHIVGSYLISLLFGLRVVQET